MWVEGVGMGFGRVMLVGIEIEWLHLVLALENA